MTSVSTSVRKVGCGAISAVRLLGRAQRHDSVSGIRAIHLSGLGSGNREALWCEERREHNIWGRVRSDG